MMPRVNAVLDHMKQFCSQVLFKAQKTYKSNVPWTRYLCDFQECQERLIKSTLVNFWKSRGMKNKANDIQLDKELDLTEDKVKALLNINNSDDTVANIMAKVEERLESMVTKEKMQEHCEGFKNFGNTVDHKLNMILFVVFNLILVEWGRNLPLSPFPKM